MTRGKNTATDYISISRGTDVIMKWKEAWNDGKIIKLKSNGEYVYEYCGGRKFNVKAYEYSGGTSTDYMFGYMLVESRVSNITEHTTTTSEMTGNIIERSNEICPQPLPHSIEASSYFDCNVDDNYDDAEQPNGNHNLNDEGRDERTLLGRPNFGT